MAQKELELDEFEQKCAFPAQTPLEVENEAKRLLGLTPSALKVMSAVQCGEAAFVLQQYSFYLQRAVNKQQARVRLAEESRNKIAVKQFDSVQGYGFEEKLQKVMSKNESCAEFHRVRVRAQLRKDRISFLDEKIKEMAHALMALQATKRGRND